MPGVVLVTGHSFGEGWGVIDSSWGLVTGGHALRCALSCLMSIDVLTRSVCKSCVSRVISVRDSSDFASRDC